MELDWGDLWDDSGEDDEDYDPLKDHAVSLELPLQAFRPGCGCGVGHALCPCLLSLLPCFYSRALDGVVVMHRTCGIGSLSSLRLSIPGLQHATPST